MQRFKRLLAIRDRLHEQFKAGQARIEGGYRVAACAAYKAAFPRKRPTPERVATMVPMPESVKPVFDRFKTVAERFCRTHSARNKAVMEALHQQAAQTKLIASETVWTRWCSVCSSTYRSQGYGEGRYARQDAEMRADIARAAGLDVHIGVRQDRWQYTGMDGRPATGCITYYDVWSPVDEMGAEVLRLKPDIDLVERVRLCWARGVNPRVYLPFLPHGFEEKAGLDFFGGRKQLAG